MHIDVMSNRGSPPTILLRESYREDGKSKKRTLANLSGWPVERIEQLRAVLRGERLLPAREAIEIVRALPHGHVHRSGSAACCGRIERGSQLSTWGTSRISAAINS